MHPFRLYEPMGNCRLHDAQGQLVTTNVEGEDWGCCVPLELPGGLLAIRSTSNIFAMRSSCARLDAMTLEDLLEMY
jgi:hypothetical protein